MKPTLFNTSWEKQVKLEVAHTLFIARLKELDLLNPKNIEDFKKEVTEKKISFIVKIAHHNSAFVQQCKNPLLDEYWDIIWSTYGLVLTNKKLGFRHYEADCPFDRARSMHFYCIGRLLQEESRKDFLYSERWCLETAITLDPVNIHAVKRYNQYLYESIDTSHDLESIESTFEAIIQNILRTKKVYSSFSYLMLAEAHYRFGLGLTEYKKVDDARKNYQDAIEYAKKAEKHILEAKDGDENTIMNASLGKGLSSSNSLGIKTTQDAILFLEKEYQKISTEPKESSSLRISSSFGK